MDKPDSMQRSTRWAALVLISASVLAPREALAQTVSTTEDAPAAGPEEAGPAYPEITGSVSLVSDYRFRGISFSDIAPAIQPFLQLSTEPGFFVSFWGSNISDFNGATTEIDISAGWSGTVAGLNASVGVLGYLYPGGSNTDTVEFFGSLGFPIGPVSTNFGLNWAPEQANLGRSSRYAFGAVTVALPGTPITLRGSLGNERGAFVSDETGRKTAKWDWLIGADVNFSAISLGVAYVGTDLPSRDAVGNRANRLGKDGVVLSLSASF